MKTTTTTLIAIITAVLPSTFAATAFIPSVFAPNNTAIHNKPISANNGQFFINSSTTAICASWDPSCPSQNTTIITGPTGSSSSDWWMGILESGGQQIFTSAGPVGGDLYYAAAGSNNILPYKASRQVFKMATTNDGRPKLVSWYSGIDYSACPVGDGSFTVHNEVLRAGCSSFEFLIQETQAPAPRYYRCVGCQSRCYNANIPCVGYYD